MHTRAETEVGTIPAAAAAAAPPPAIGEPPEVVISDREKNVVLWLSNVNHLLNHFQNQMMYVMYPAIAFELGLLPIHLGLLTAGRTVFNNWVQLGWGFLTPFVPRFQ